MAKQDDLQEAFPSTPDDGYSCNKIDYINLVTVVHVTTLCLLHLLRKVQP